MAVSQLLSDRERLQEMWLPNRRTAYMYAAGTSIVYTDSQTVSKYYFYCMYESICLSMYIYIHISQTCSHACTILATSLNSHFPTFYASSRHARIGGMTSFRTWSPTASVPAGRNGHPARGLFGRFRGSCKQSGISDVYLEHSHPTWNPRVIALDCQDFRRVTKRTLCSLPVT